MSFIVLFFSKSSHTSKEDELQRILMVTNEQDEKSTVDVSYRFGMHDCVGNVAPIADISVGTHFFVTFLKSLFLLKNQLPEMYRLDNFLFSIFLMM